MFISPRSTGGVSQGSGVSMTVLVARLGLGGPRSPVRSGETRVIPGLPTL